jgi:excisionase family DNA binding protein
VITVSEAAKLAGVGDETVRRWVRAGRLQSRRDGPRLLLFREEVERIASPTSLPLPPAWQESWLRTPPDWVAALSRTRRGVR